MERNKHDSEPIRKLEGVLKKDRTRLIRVGDCEDTTTIERTSTLAKTRVEVRHRFTLYRKTNELTWKSRHGEWRHQFASKEEQVAWWSTFVHPKLAN